MNTFSLRTLLALAVLATGFSVAQADDLVVARAETLRARIKSLEDAKAAAKAAAAAAEEEAHKRALAIQTDFVRSSEIPGNGYVLKIGDVTRVLLDGDLQFLYLYDHDSNHDTVLVPNRFLLRIANVYFQAMVTKSFGVLIQVNWALTTAALRNAHLFVRFPHHELRLGQFRTMFGYESRLAEVANWFPNRPYVVGFQFGVNQGIAFGPSPFDVGIGLNGSWDLPKGFGVDYQFSIVNGTGPNNLDTTNFKTVWARLGGSLSLPRQNLRVSLGGSFGAGDSTGTPPYVRGAIDAAISWKHIFASFEYIYSHRFTSPILTNAVIADTRALNQSGWALTLIGHLPWNTGPMFRYDTFRISDLDVQNVRRRYTLGWYYQTAERTSSTACFRIPGFCPKARFVVAYELDKSDAQTDRAAPLYSTDNQLQLLVQTEF